MQVINGDCLEVLKTLPDNSVDAIVTDPPAGIAFMGKEWDKDKGGRDNWIAWMSEVASECLRVIKPGGHALVWALPRTSHWTGMAWENGGWEPRDKCVHLFGSGFPKSLDISKQIDKTAGAEREVVGVTRGGVERGGKYGESNLKESEKWHNITARATDEAKQWDGWGTALKPAHEDWWLFRKPLAEKTVAANVLEHGTGGLNIDGCRVDGEGWSRPSSNRQGYTYQSVDLRIKDIDQASHSQGRFPANVTHDGSEAVVAVFPVTTSGKFSQRTTPANRAGTYSGFDMCSGDVNAPNTYGDSGSATRFFYCAKASKRDRDEGLDGFEEIKCGLMEDDNYPIKTGSGNLRETKRSNHHPTVKNTELMRYFCRLITPPGGIILDPFCGSGSTGKGAVLEGFEFIGIEQDKEYAEIARARIAYVMEEPEPTLEERIQWLETQVKAQGIKIKQIQKHQQLSLFG